MSYRKDLNNYNATDVPGQTTRIVNFTLAQPVDNAVLHLIISNHGANAGGEEYVRRMHYVYLDDQLLKQFKPGGSSCEPFRQFNTQGNGIYSATEKPLRNWLSWNNWCPGDAIPNREIKLGNLAAGNHTIKIDVPDAVFMNAQGYFPISMYIQNSQNGQVICEQPTDFAVTSQIGNVVQVGWQQPGNATDWQLVWGRKSAYSASYDTYQDVSGNPSSSLGDLIPSWSYETYIQTKCLASGNKSVWTGPVFSAPIVLGTNENALSEISVFPNPAKDVVTVKSSQQIEELFLYSQDGKKLMHQKENSLHIAQLGKGVYLLTIHLKNGKTQTHKIVKE